MKPQNINTNIKEMTSIKTLLIISLMCNIALISIGVLRYHSTHQPQPITSSFNYRNGAVRQAVYSKMPIDAGDIVFVGNSITEGFPVYEFFPGAKVKNRGISGNWTYQVVNRLPAIVAAHPTKLFIEMGINDLIYQVSVDSIIKNYRKAIHITQQGSPSTELFIQSLTPGTYEFKYLNPSIVQVNDSLQQLCKQFNIHYVNLYHAMLKGDALDSSLTVDGLHYNAKAYQIWVQHIHCFIQ